MIRGRFYIVTNPDGEVTAIAPEAGRHDLYGITPPGGHSLHYAVDVPPEVYGGVRTDDLAARMRDYMRTARDVTKLDPEVHRTFLIRQAMAGR
jgi:hypothetical protein